MLLTKLNIPNPGKNLVQRSSALEKLNEGLNHKLILVTAPAGYGKTTLISDWIVRHEIPAAWFSIDKTDNDSVEFLTYIIYGIQKISADFGFKALNYLKASNHPAVRTITDFIINEILKINKDFLLVLDDYHLIENNEIHEAISHLLEHIPENIHVTILTRTDPQLPVAKLRSKRQLIEISTDDLCFSANDIHVLFNKKLKIKLSVENAISLESKTEGWIAGLHLTALSVHAHDDISVFIRQLKGNNRYITDYLVEEVLKFQTDDIKKFLIYTSILDHFSASLCNAVLNRDDSQVALEYLERNNVFVILLDKDRCWYRYHHLFADVLKQKLLLAYKPIVNELHIKACEWFERNKMHDLAVDHALMAEDYPNAIRILGNSVESMWKIGLHASVMKYGDLIPDKLIKTNPEFCLYYSWVLITSGQIQKAVPYLENAGAIIQKIINDRSSAKENIQNNRKLLGKIAVANAYLKSHTTDTEEIFEYCNTAIENLSENDPLWLGWAWFCYGVAHFSKGNLQESSDVFRKAFNYGKKSGNIYLISTIALRMSDNEQQLGHYRLAYEKCADFLTFMKNKGYSEIVRGDWSYAGLFAIMGGTQYMWADIDGAFESAKIAYDLCKMGRDVMLETSVLMLYSMVLHDKGDYTESEMMIAEAENLCRKYNLSPYLLYALMAWKLFRLTELNQTDKSDELISEYNLEADREITHTNETIYMVYARLLLDRGEVKKAESVLSKLFTIITFGNRIERLIDLKISYAIFYKLTGEIEMARASLTEAIELAAPENLLMFFISAIRHIHEMLREIIKIQAVIKSKISKQFMNDLMFIVEKRLKRKKKASAMIELSNRETDTLRLIAENLSNQEIADRLFVSLTTTKTHVRNILQKLNVKTRIQAVAKAKELGIV